MEKDILFEIKNLKTHFKTEAGVAKAVDGVTFNIYKGEILGLVGESGSGKSVTSLSINRLIPMPPGEIVDGEILYKGVDLLKLSYKEMRKYRGKDIAMIFQEPMTSLNPVYKIGMQLNEIVLQHFDVSKDEARQRSIKMLEKVSIPDAEKRMDEYPHQFSGGMRQRVMIAMALLNDPALLIADEPTTALDVTIQAQILNIIQDLNKTREDSATLLITHDLAVIAEMCDRVIVMYGGKHQEIADVYELFKNPLHPYTLGLMNSIPRPDKKIERLDALRGMVVSITNMPVGCKFSTRCDKKMDICDTEEPELIEVTPSHFVRCHLYKNKE